MRLLRLSKAVIEPDSYGRRRPRQWTSRQPSLDDSAFEIVEYQGDDIPPYAILSHTWSTNSDDEVTYQELREGLGKQKPGYTKIKACGEIAAQNGIGLFWVDTCCIDKSSSAELTEAINSMFRWYQKAKICYAYLSDVPARSDIPGTILDLAAFRSSRWFTRGWTLQELIAPFEIEFFSMGWQHIGNKQNLRQEIFNITGIFPSVLDGTTELDLISVANRMSWAAKRTTTRVEDIAYCLLGIFNVNMPLLYGEREKAFFRLQEEIIKSSVDQSLFAWSTPGTVGLPSLTGLLAPSPAYFAGSADVRNHGALSRSTGCVLTSNGMLVDLFLTPTQENPGIYIASLECYHPKSLLFCPGIYLQRTHLGLEFPSEHHFCRIWSSTPIFWLEPVHKVDGRYERIFIPHEPLTIYTYPTTDDKIVFLIQPETDVVLNKAFPSDRYDSQTTLLIPEHEQEHGILGALLLLKNGICYLVMLGILEEGSPWCHVQVATENAEQDWALYEPTGRESKGTEIRIDDQFCLQIVLSTIGLLARSHFVVTCRTASRSIPGAGEAPRDVSRLFIAQT